jgi:hypothetical protein
VWRRGCCRWREIRVNRVRSYDRPGYHLFRADLPELRSTDGIVGLADSPPDCLDIDFSGLLRVGPYNDGRKMDRQSKLSRDKGLARYSIFLDSHEVVEVCAEFLAPESAILPTERHIGILR